MPPAKPVREPLKDRIYRNLKMIIVISVGVFSVIGTIGGGVLYVDNNFAHAGDVQQMLKQQKEQIDLAKQHQRANLLFQLEYYDNKIKLLQMEKNKAMTLKNSPNISPSIKMYIREPNDIQDEINDLKIRREFVRKSLSGG